MSGGISLSEHLVDLEWYMRRSRVPESSSELRSQRVVAVDTSSVSGVPCIVCSSGDAKQVLSDLRKAGWHGFKNSTRQLLTPLTPRSSKRAFQITDAAFDIVQRVARGEDVGALTEPQEAIAAMLRTRAIAFHPCFALHQYIIDDHPHEEFIRFLAAHDLPPTASVCRCPPPSPQCYLYINTRIPHGRR